MARTPSNMMPLGTKAPEFKLYDTCSGHEVSLSSVKGEKGTVVMFICNHCPFVVHVLDELVSVGQDFKDQGIGFVAISSNDVENYPQDSPEKMRELAMIKHFPFPYLYDSTQEVAKSYDAACTPDLFVFDADLNCVYRGQLDGARPGNDVPVNGEDLRAALQCLVDGEPVSSEQIPSVGCNIKWKESSGASVSN